MDEKRIRNRLDNRNLLSRVWKGGVDLGRGLREECIGDLIDLRGIVLQVSALRSNICGRNQQSQRRHSLDVDVPLLNVGWHVLTRNRLGNRLHDLRHELLCSLRPEAATRW